MPWSPFLLPHYEEIYIVDSRFYSIGAAGKNIIEFIGDQRINKCCSSITWKM